MVSDPKKYFIIYLIILSITGGIVIYLAGSKVGPGISNDAAMMLSVAGNLTKGRGLIDFRGNVLTQFPPLYPMLLSIGSLLFKRDIILIGWIINILVFSAIIWFSSLIFWKAFSHEPVFAYIASFVIFSSSSIIKISANIASDPLFMLIVILFLMGLSAYLSTEQNKFLILAGILIIIGCSQRYAGLSLVPAGCLVVAYKNRNNFSRAILSVLFFGISTAVPVFLWGYLHNYPINGIVFGERIPYMPMLNFIAGAEKFLNWFIPSQIISLTNPVILSAAIVGVFIFVIFRFGVKDFMSSMSTPLAIPHIAFFSVYITVLIFNITPEFQGVETDRAHIIILPSLLIILLTAGSYIKNVINRKIGKVRSNIAVILLFIIWSIYPISKTYDYLQRSIANGDVSSYNSLNKSDIKDIELTRSISGLEINNNQIYSNGEAAVWLILRVQVHSLPSNPSGHKPSLTYLEQNYSGWPGWGNKGYLIWFNNFASKEYLATPEQLSTIAVLNKIYSDENGSIYSLSPR